MYFDNFHTLSRVDCEFLEIIFVIRSHNYVNYLLPLFNNFKI